MYLVKLYISVFVVVCTIVANNDESPVSMKLKKWLKTPTSEQDGGGGLPSGGNTLPPTAPTLNQAYDSSNTGNHHIQSLRLLAFSFAIFTYYCFSLLQLHFFSFICFAFFVFIFTVLFQLFLRRILRMVNLRFQLFILLFLLLLSVVNLLT